MEMDAITAHLDRGWDLLGRGDFSAARVSAHHILQLDSDSPEGHTLLGAIAAAEGDPEEALELFRRALDADPDYLDALIYAAETAIHPLGDFAYALTLCDEAEELIGEQEEMLDVWLLRAEAHIGQGDCQAAQRALDMLPSGGFPEASYQLRVGRVCLDVDRRQEAIERLEHALEEPSCALDAHYLLGLAKESEGRLAEAMHHLLKVHQLDNQLPRPNWAQPPERFREMAERAVGALPDSVSAQLAGVPLQVREYPALELVADGFDPRAMVMFAGISAEAAAAAVSSTRRRRPSNGDPSEAASDPEPGGELAVDRDGAALSCVFVFQRNVERFACSVDAAAEELRRALVQEAGFFYALDDDEIERLLEAH